MADQPLNPELREVAEQYLGRPLGPQEVQRLATLQQGIQRQPAPSANAIEQARTQMQQAISDGQALAGSSMRDILETIQASAGKALQVQEKEEQAILGLLDNCKSLAELRPSNLQPAMSVLQPGSQLALTQIAERLSNLARQEVESLFNQYVGPLAAQLQTMVQRLNDQDAARAANASASPAGADGASTQVVASSTASSAASSTANSGANAQAAMAGTALQNAVQTDVHDNSARTSMD
jgi:hypothetical protein